MKLTILSSNSSGNCYVLQNDHEKLIIECGVRMALIKQAISFDLQKVTGCIVTHEHQDHCCAIKDMMAAGIEVYTSNGTIAALGLSSHRLHPIENLKEFQVGNFKVKAFDAVHDCKEPFNYLIEHPEIGRMVFITDTIYCHYTFPGLTNILIEANYSQDILDERLSRGAAPEFLRNRVLKSHMSLETCKEFLLANDLSQVNNIVLIHLSDGNSNADRFQKEVAEATGCSVHIARKNIELDFNKKPF